MRIIWNNPVTCLHDGLCRCANNNIIPVIQNQNKWSWEKERIFTMNKKQIWTLVITIFAAVLLGSGVGFLYANQTNPGLEKAALEQEMEEQLKQETEALSE